MFPFLDWNNLSCFEINVQRKTKNDIKIINYLKYSHLLTTSLIAQLPQSTRSDLKKKEK